MQTAVRAVLRTPTPADRSCHRFVSEQRATPPSPHIVRALTISSDTNPERVGRKLAAFTTQKKARIYDGLFEQPVERRLLAFVAAERNVHLAAVPSSPIAAAIITCRHGHRLAARQVESSDCEDDEASVMRRVTRSDAETVGAHGRASYGQFACACR